MIFLDLFIRWKLKSKTKFWNAQNLISLNWSQRNNECISSFRRTFKRAEFCSEWVRKRNLALNTIPIQSLTKNLLYSNRRSQLYFKNRLNSISKTDLSSISKAVNSIWDRGQRADWCLYPCTRREKRSSPTRSVASTPVFASWRVCALVAASEGPAWARRSAAAHRVWTLEAVWAKGLSAAASTS